MKYRQGAFGRVFLVKFDDQDDLLQGLKNIAISENIRIGTITLLGGLRAAGVVSGPRLPVIPPDPLWFDFNDGREVLGIGTLLWKSGEPVIHLHGAIGRDQQTVAGCIRKDSSVYLIIEAVIAEIVGIEAARALNEKTGLVMLEL